MPTYTYRCKKCGHEFDARQSMMDAPLTDCPVCEGQLRRVVGRVGVVFKGSGFYVTDNRGSNGKGKHKKTSEKSGEKSEGKATEKEISSGNKAKSESKSGETAKSKSTTD